MKRSIWIGYEPRQFDAFAVAKHSILKHTAAFPVHGIVLSDMERRGLYTRKYHLTCGQMVDHISDAPMSTQFAITRFLTPHLARGGLALYVDCDVLFRANVSELFNLYDGSKAVMCVQHVHRPRERLKMEGKVQTYYDRKNWSSVMLFNCDHTANAALTIDMINQVPGRDLHRFCWLEDSLIGALPQEWNHLAGYTKGGGEPKLVHFTDGLPTIGGYENMEYADEWREALLDCVR